MNTNVVGKFEIVNESEFITSMNNFIKGNVDKYYKHPNIFDYVYNNIQLPQRHTVGSAGYDFFFPYLNTTVKSGESIHIPTGIKCKIADGWCLALMVRSSYGRKFKASLDDTIGIVDWDYYSNEENDGHIWIQLSNNSEKKEPLILEHGCRYAQGIFLPYGITEDDNVINIRTKGSGSAGN